MRFLLPAVALILAGAALNWVISGRALPATFYAKSDFYGGVGAIGALRYVWEALGVLFFSPLLVLLPGLAAAVARWRRTGAGGNGSLLLGLLVWAALLPTLYLVRLPVLYHHGRYLMPVIPAVIVIACWGGEWACRRTSFRRIARLYPALVVAFFGALWINGAQVFGWNVKYIQDEQVRVAEWLRDNTAPSALVATHDVGAIGYFADRPLIDLAGLVTPEVGDRVRDEEFLWNYLRDRRAEYLAVLPDWYPGLIGRPGSVLVFEVTVRYVIEAGGTNFRIYRLPSDIIPPEGRIAPEAGRVAGP